MKKILALALAIVLAFAIAVPVFAASTTTGDVTIADSDIAVGGTFPQKTGDSYVEYNVSGNYIVTIPASITLVYAGVDELAASDPLNVRAEDVLIPYGKELRVSISSERELVYDANDDDVAEDIIEFVLCASSATAIDTNTILRNGVILVINDGGENNDDKTLAGEDREKGSADDQTYFGIKTTNFPKYNGKYEGYITFTVDVVVHTTADNFANTPAQGQ